MDMEGEGEEGSREKEAMVQKEGSVLMGFYLGGGKDIINKIKPGWRGSVIGIQL